MQKSKTGLLNQSTSIKQLTKQASSPLLGQHSSQSFYTDLVYSRRRDFAYLTNKNQQNFKKPQTKRIPIILAKPKKQPILVKPQPQAQKIQEARTNTQNATIFSKIMRRSKVQPLEKQKKHFRSSFNPEIIHNYTEESSERTTSKKQMEDKPCSSTRYRKIVDDFDDRIGFGATGLIPGASRFQDLGNSGKKHTYRLNMFKESQQLGIEDTRNHTRKPCLMRNYSMVHFG